MTNKIHLSFNHLYRIKDGDYHGAKLNFKIKHGDKVIAEGEHVGKTLSKFVSPITIEETEITQPLTVEYVCTGNVEDVSVSPTLNTPDGRFTFRDAQVFFSESFILGPSPYLPPDWQGLMVCGVPQGGISGKSDAREMKVPDEFSEQVRSVIRRELLAGGLLWKK
jgi:hypothetical protein